MSSSSQPRVVMYDHGARVVVVSGPHAGRTGTVRRNLSTACLVSVLLDGSERVDRFTYGALQPAAAPASEPAALPPPEASGSASILADGPVPVADLLHALRACHELYLRACREGVL